MATALVTQIAYAVQTLFDPAGTAGRLVDLGKLANYGLLTSFTPAYLFTTGVNGAWYDPSDFSTMFQDAAGTTPVTAVGQPVGLMLDKSKGLVLGPELMVFTSNPSIYTFSDSSGASVDSSLEVTKTAANGICAISLITAPGKSYKLTVPVRKGTVTENSFRLLSSSAYLSGFHNNASPNKNDGVLTLVFSATSATSWIYIQHYDVQLGTFYVDNISVRELPGNHAFNPSGNSANFPVLSARYNLLTKTEDFSDAVWSKAGGATYANNTIAPDGTLTGVLFIENTSNTNHGCWQNTNSIPTAVNSKYIVSLKYHSRRYVRVAWVTGGGLDSVYTDVDLIAGTIVNQGPYSGATQSSVSITSVGSGWYTVEIKGTLPSATTYATVYARNSSSNSNPESAFAYTGDGVSGFYIWHPDLRVANDALNQPAYQRVNTATDYDTVGFKPYLSFNGVNQWLQTNSIDFTYGDKMFVSAGVRKLSDAAIGILCELSASSSASNGTFALYAPISAGANFGGFSRGTSNSYAGTPASYPSPITNVLGALGDISGDTTRTRVNSAQAAINTTDQGTGNYGNYPLYIGARAGSSLWFNGRLHQLIVAGKQASASEIASTEAYLNQKTGAY